MRNCIEIMSTCDTDVRILSSSCTVSENTGLLQGSKCQQSSINEYLQNSKVSYICRGFQCFEKIGHYTRKFPEMQFSMIHMTKPIS